MELVLVRHAEPEWVREGLSVDDPPLTVRGARQADRLADRLQREAFDDVFVSPLVRARQTAEPVLAALDRKEEIDPWLEEIRKSGGQSEEQLRLKREGREKRKQAARAERAIRELQGQQNVLFLQAGVSSRAELEQRTKSLVRHQELARLHGYDNIPTTLIHGDVIPGALTKEQAIRRELRKRLTDSGLHEVISYSFTSPARTSLFPALTGNVKAVRLAMPMSEERSVLRTTLIAQLIETDALLFRGGDIHGPDRRGGRVDRHAGGNLVERDAVEKELHVFKRRDGDPANTEFPFGFGLVGVVAH